MDFSSLQKQFFNERAASMRKRKNDEDLLTEKNSLNDKDSIVKLRKKSLLFPHNNENKSSNNDQDKDVIKINLHLEIKLKEVENPKKLINDHYISNIKGSILKRKQDKNNTSVDFKNNNIDNENADDQNKAKEECPDLEDIAFKKKDTFGKEATGNIINQLDKKKKNESEEKEKEVFDNDLQKHLYLLSDVSNKQLKSKIEKKLSVNFMQKFKSELSVHNKRITTAKNQSFNDSSPKVFWNQEKLKYIRKKLRNAKERILEKTEEDFEMLNSHIQQQNEEEIVATLTDENFKYFYKQDVEKRDILQKILINCRSELLKKILSDDFYKFRKTYVMEYILQLIEYYEIDNKLEEDQTINDLLNKSENLQEFNLEFNYFSNDDQIKKFSNTFLIINNLIWKCLKYNYQDLAIFIVNAKGHLVDFENAVINSIEYDSMIFLSYLWHSKYELSINKSVKFTQNNFIPKIAYTSTIKSPSKISFNKSSFHDQDESVKEFNKVEIIMNWDHLEKEKFLVPLLFELNCFEEINNLISSKKTFRANFSRDHFKKAIFEFQHEIINFFLRKNDFKTILEEKDIQKFIVKRYFHELCSNISKVLKRRDILTCHSPILTCVLLCEFLESISEISNQNLSKCKKIIFSLEKLSRSIQDATPDEKYLDYLMSQKDVENRTIYKIASDNNFYQMLQSPEIGSIVKKMWEGRNLGEDIFQSSCLFNFLTHLHLKSPFSLNDDRNANKAYSFQYESWKDSCALRFYPEMLSTIFLILIYNFYIYFLVDADLVEEKFINLPFKIKFLLYVYAIWTASIALNITNLAIFRILTNRNFKWDTVTSIEFLMFIVAFSLFIDTDYYPVLEQLQIVEQFGLSYKFLIRATLLSLNDVLVWLRICGIMLTFKQIGPLISMIYMLLLQMWKYIILYLIYLVITCIIFMSLFYRSSNQFSEFNVGLTTLFGGFINTFNTFDFDKNQSLGAVMIMLYVTLSGMILINFLIANLSNIYKKFSVSVDSSYRSILISYTQRYKWDPKFGFLVFLTTPFSLLNSLALPLIWVYWKLYKSKLNFCALICSLCRKKNSNNNKNKSKSSSSKFNQKSSLMLKGNVLTYNSINNNKNKNATEKKLEKSKSLLGLNLKAPSIKKLGDAVAKVYFSIFYLPFIISSYFFYLNLLAPLCYVKGLLELLYVEFLSSGLPFLFLIVYNDIYFVIKTAFTQGNNFSHEDVRIKQSLKPADVILFLEFIHQRAQENDNDLHSVFMDYLQFEKNKLKEFDAKLKEKDKYRSKLNANINKEERRTTRPSIFMRKNYKMNLTDYSSSYNNNNNNNNNLNRKKSFYLESDSQNLNTFNYYMKKENRSQENKNSYLENPANLSSSFVKRNIIIIEILENFLIDDASDNCLLDIEKMQQLLPKSRNIDQAYLNRLLFTNLNYINKALTALKKKENKHIQHQLTNRLVYAVNSIDERIDRYVKIEKDEVKNNTIHNDLVDYDSDDENENNQFFENEVREILEVISNDINDQIKAYEEI